MGGLVEANQKYYMNYYLGYSYKNPAFLGLLFRMGLQAVPTYPSNALPLAPIYKLYNVFKISLLMEWSYIKNQKELPQIKNPNLKVMNFTLKYQKADNL